MAYIIPFNHQPVSTGQGSGSYTVTSGKYARVVATLSAYAYVSSGTFGSGSAGDIDVSSNSTTVELWLKAGDSLSVSNTGASATVGASSVGGSVSTAILNVNSNPVARVSAACSAIGSGAGSSYTISGSANIDYFYEEYNVIS